MQIKQAIQERSRPLCITQMQSHTGFPASLANENEEIDQLLIENVFEVSELRSNHHVNSKDLKKKISIT